MTARETVVHIASALAPLYDAGEARAIALLTAAALLGTEPQRLLTDPGAEVEVDGLDAAVAQLCAGRPVQYVTGRAEFLGRRFAVREGVLIPRPETEELAMWVVRDQAPTATLLDVGTGSGCLAATLALEMPEAEVFAADTAPAALEVAAENFRSLGARVTLRRADALGSLWEVFPERFDAIVSNPPYIPLTEREALHPNVRDHEPAEALFVPDDDPLRFYRAIARAGRRMLLPDGRLYFEIHPPMAEALRRLLAAEGYSRIEVREDLNGKLRMACGSRS